MNNNIVVTQEVYIKRGNLYMGINGRLFLYVPYIREQLCQSNLRKFHMQHSLGFNLIVTEK